MFPEAGIQARSPCLPSQSKRIRSSRTPEQKSVRVPSLTLRHATDAVVTSSTSSIPTEDATLVEMTSPTEAVSFASNHRVNAHQHDGRSLQRHRLPRPTAQQHVGPAPLPKPANRIDERTMEDEVSLGEMSAPSLHRLNRANNMARNAISRSKTYGKRLVI